MRIIAFVTLSTFFAISCKPDYKPEITFSPAELDRFTVNMLPYLYKKPDHVEYQDRAKPEHSRHYLEIHKASEGHFTMIQRMADTIYFNFTYKDRSSLYEHYRSFGGKVTLDQNLQPVYLNLLYHTDRLEPNLKEEISNELFRYMVKHKNVDPYIGNRAYIKTPNADFQYNVNEKHWEMTENSSWKFLEEMKQDAENAMK